MPAASPIGMSKRGRSPALHYQKNQAAACDVCHSMARPHIGLLYIHVLAVTAYQGLIYMSWLDSMRMDAVLST